MVGWLVRLVGLAGCLVEHYIGCTDCPVTLGPAHPRPPLIPPLLSAPSPTLLCSALPRTAFLFLCISAICRVLFTDSYLQDSFALRTSLRINVHSSYLESKTLTTHPQDPCCTGCIYTAFRCASMLTTNYMQSGNDRGWCDTTSAL